VPASVIQTGARTRFYLGRIGGNPDALMQVYRLRSIRYAEILFGCPQTLRAHGGAGRQNEAMWKSPHLSTQAKVIICRPACRSDRVDFVGKLSLEYLMDGRNDSPGVDWIQATDGHYEAPWTYANLARQTQYIARVQGSNLLNPYSAFDRASGERPIRSRIAE